MLTSLSNTAAPSASFLPLVADSPAHPSFILKTSLTGASSAAAELPTAAAAPQACLRFYSRPGTRSCHSLDFIAGCSGSVAAPRQS